MKETNIFKYITLLVGVLIINTTILFGQGGIIKGKIISATDGTTMPGASVVELDRNNRVIKGTITDIDGSFSLKVNNKNNKLQISFIGYKTIVVDINNQSTINSQLEEDIHQIEGVEIVAEGRTNTGFLEIDDRNLAIPVAKLSAKDIENVQASTIDEALQGRLSGVDIVSNSGNPGGGMSIRIRGVSTLRADSKPLIVIDNIPYDINISPDFDFATSNEEGYAQMLNISLDDIREITVLKDAASTALWGTKAANGVLFITTKRGNRGQKPIVSYTYRGTYTFEPQPIPLLNGNQYSTLILEGEMNVAGIPLNTDDHKEFQYDPSNPYWYYNYGQNTNWLDEISRNGFIHNHDFSIAGGGTKAFYRFSTNYQDEQGVTLGTNLNRLTSRLNLDYNISDKLMLRADFSYAHGTSNANYDKYLRSKAYTKMPNMAVYEYDAYGNETPVFFSPEENIQGTFVYASKYGIYDTKSGTYNPVAMSETGLYKTVNDRIISKFNLNYTIIEGLKYAFDVSFDINNTKRNLFLPQIATGKPWTDINVNRATDRDEDSYTIYTNNRLTYHKIFNDIHDVAATVQYQTNDYRGITYTAITSNSASSELRDPSNPSRIQESGLEISTSTWQNRDDGILSLLYYTLLDRYIFSVGLRREGNSKFDKKYRHAFFPMTSAAWRISGEPFMKGFTFIDDLRLRYSYGENGHAPTSSYEYFNNYNTYAWTYLGYLAVYPVDMQLENLKWESFITNNLGFTLEMFNGRLMLDYDIYKNRTKDMLAPGVSIPTSSGYSSILMNLGTLDNQGWDFGFRSYPIKTKDFSVTFDFNISRNYNILRKVADDYPLERGRTTANGEYKRIVQIDNPIGSFYGYRYLGVYTDEEDLIAIDENGHKIYDANGNPVYVVFNYPSINYEFQPGDAKYEDINHDGNINYLDVVYLGDANPDFTGGFGSMIKYKAFSFNFFFYGRYGNEIINDTKMQGEKMHNYDNQTTSVLRRWRKPGDETDIPRALIGYGYNWLGSDRFVEDGSFLRLKYITLVYDIPSKYLDKIKIQSMRVSATINNLLTFTNYLGQDPEITIKSTDNTFYTVGYDYSNTPVTKQITMNVSLTF